MSWTYRLSHDAAKQLRRLPKDRQEQIARAAEGMSESPFTGDVRPIKSGKFRGAYRRRVGRYRIVFSFDFVNRAIDVAEILARSETTHD